MDSKIFRKVALEKLSSPEQLDQAIRVTNPRGWAALCAFGALLLATVVWSVIGRIPVEVSGGGMLLRRAGVFGVFSPSSGMLAEVLVKANDEVRRGQTVARIAQPELARSVELARADVAQVQAIYDVASRNSSAGLALGIGDLARRRTYLDDSIAIASDRIAHLEDKVASTGQLFAKGLIGRDAMIAAETELNDARQAKVALTDERKELVTKELDLRSGKVTEQQRAALELSEAKNRLAELESQLASAAQVTSPFDGKVTAILAEQGEVVAPGSGLFQLEVPDMELNAVLFVSPLDGKKVLPGMRVHLSPANVREEEYGFMLATVTSVSEFPAPRQQLMSLLQNADLVEALSSGGSPYEVALSLERNPATRSGFRWSSRRDPPFRITSGTLCSGSVVIAEHRPIALVIPALKKETGL